MEPGDDDFSKNLLSDLENEGLTLTELQTFGVQESASTQPDLLDELGGGFVTQYLQASATITPNEESKQKKQPTYKNKDEEWKTRRREQVARASKTAREKRKRELLGLRSENKRLREERVEFIRKINVLEEKVDGFRAQAFANIQLENEILRAQLDEHKKFVASFMKLASGAPSTEDQRYRIYRKGADFAVNHALNLMKQAVRDNWHTADPPNSEDKATYRYRFVKEFGEQKDESSNSASQIQSERLNLRIDIELPGIQLQDVVELYWQLWNDRETQMHIYGLENTKGHEFERLLLDKVKNGTDLLEDEKDEALISAAYYREIAIPPEKDKDLVFVSMKRKEQLNLNVLEFNFHDDSSSNASVPGYVFGRSSTEHLQTPRSANAQRIKSLLLEGCVFWQSKSSVHQIIVLSFPGDLSFRELSGPAEILSKEGKITAKFHSYFKNYFKALQVLPEGA